MNTLTIKLFIFYLIHAQVSYAQAKSIKIIVDSCYSEVSSDDFSCKFPSGNSSYHTDLMGPGPFGALEAPTSADVSKAIKIKEEISGLLTAHNAGVLEECKKAALAQCITARMVKYKSVKTIQDISTALASRKGWCSDFSEIFTAIAATAPLSLWVNEAHGQFIGKNGGSFNHAYNAVVLNGEVYLLEPQASKSFGVFYTSPLYEGFTKRAMVPRDLPNAELTESEYWEKLKSFQE